MDLERPEDIIEPGSPEALSYLQVAITFGICTINEGRQKLLGVTAHPDKNMGNQTLNIANKEELYV